MKREESLPLAFQARVCCWRPFRSPPMRRLKQGSSLSAARRQAAEALTLVAGLVTVSNRFMGGGVKFVHEQTTGTLEIIRRLAAAESQKKDALGSFGSTDGYNAYKGRFEYSSKPFPGLRAVIYNQLVDLYLAVPVNSPIKTYADVKGKRIGMGGPGSSVANTGLLTLEQYGVKKEDFKPYYFVYKESIEGLQDGSLDGAFSAGGYGLCPHTLSSPQGITFV